ncbi:hypothetical protein [Prescottella equi]|uniref:hypothetical protein n=1 Tax=Rhodococcus hoagii TaxID=43767 RepID=UPI000A107B0F|nr:hypothetical protein [Prescottella equi]
MVPGANDPSWLQLGAEAEAGNLVMERGAAAQCAKRCDDFVVELSDLRSRASRLAHVDGLGQLPSGIALSAKFGGKAAGGEGSLDRVLAGHIAVVEQMRDVFLAIENRYAAAEEANTAAAAAVESQIN